MARKSKFRDELQKQVIEGGVKLAGTVLVSGAAFLAAQLFNWSETRKLQGQDIVEATIVEN